MQLGLVGGVDDGQHPRNLHRTVASITEGSILHGAFHIGIRTFYVALAIEQVGKFPKRNVFLCSALHVGYCRDGKIFLFLLVVSFGTINACQCNRRNGKAEVLLAMDIIATLQNTYGFVILTLIQ